MCNTRRQYLKRAFSKALGVAFVVDVFWVIRNKTGWSPYLHNGSPKSWAELFDIWPSFLLSTSLAFAIVFLWTWWRGQDYFICSGCQKAYGRGQINNGLCPSCSHPLEPIDGFYERHPEFADKVQQQEERTE